MAPINHNHTLVHGSSPLLTEYLRWEGMKQRTRLSPAPPPSEDKFSPVAANERSRTRTCGLRVMSPTSYHLLHPAMGCKDSKIVQPL